MQNAQLLSHVDTDLVTRDQVRLATVPEPTSTWRPIPHIELVESLEQVLHRCDLEAYCTSCSKLLPWAL